MSLTQLINVYDKIAKSGAAIENTSKCFLILFLVNPYIKSKNYNWLNTLLDYFQN